MSTVSPPTNIGYGTVTGQFILDIVDSADPGDDPDFVAASGTITFTASVPKLLDVDATPNAVTVVRVKIVGILDGAGYLCTPLANGSAGSRGLKLIATDDADLNPVDWTWHVEYGLRGADGAKLTAPREHNMELPEGTTVDLTAVQPVESSTGNAIIKGEKGDQGDQGDQGIQGIQGEKGDQGDQGDQGIQGATGVRGSEWFSGHGAPGTIVGSLLGDQYLDLDTGDIYELS